MKDNVEGRSHGRRSNPKEGITVATESIPSLETGDVPTPRRSIRLGLPFRRSIIKKTSEKPTRVWNVRAIVVGDECVGRYVGAF